MSERTLRRLELAAVGLKACARCGESKPLTEFPKHSKGRGGLAPDCRACHRDYHRSRYIPVDGLEAAQLKRQLADAGLKRCIRCLTTYPQAEFYEGRGSVCKACYRANYRAYANAYREANPEKSKAYYEANRGYFQAYRRAWVAANAEKIRTSWLRLKYDLSQGEYDRLLADQGGHCALCPAEFSTRAGKRIALSVDHCHDCQGIDRRGSVRGILCDPCNRLLEYRPDRHDYLSRHICPAGAAHDVAS